MVVFLTLALCICTIALGEAESFLDASVPLEEESVPLEEESVPLEEESVPLEEESVPLEEESVPLEDESVPLEDESVPLEDESAPLEDESAPLEDESAPLEEEAVPPEEESVPPEEESTPLAVGPVPVNEAVSVSVCVLSFSVAFIYSPFSITSVGFRTGRFPISHAIFTLWVPINSASSSGSPSSKSISITSRGCLFNSSRLSACARAPGNPVGRGSSSSSAARQGS